MEARGAVCLSLWTSLGLLLISGAAGETRKFYTFALNGPAQLDIPSCATSAEDQVEWKSGNKRLLKQTLSKALQDELDKQCNCKIMANGALYLQRLEKEEKYDVVVYNNKGVLKCSTSVTAKTQYPVDQPFLNHTCKGKRKAEVDCVVSRGSDPEIQLKQDGKNIQMLNGKLPIFVWKSQSTNVTCTASNNVSQTSTSLTINCEGDVENWLIYLAAAAGGVAFIIFIVLAVCSVRSCRRPNRERAEETTYCNNRRQVLQERRLPQPPVQASAPPPSYMTTTDETEEVSPQNPPTQRQGAAPEAAPTGKKGRRTRPRPPEPPNGQPESLPLNPQGPTKPALPGNHPKDQPPKPTPRTKSKPPRQNRKSR